MSSWWLTVTARGSVPRHKDVAFLDLIRGITTTNNGRNTQLTSNDCCMASSTTTVGDDGASLLPLLDDSIFLSKLNKHKQTSSILTVNLSPETEIIIFKLQFFHILHLKIYLYMDLIWICLFSKYHNRLPIWIGHIGHQHLTLFKLTHLIDACQDIHLQNLGVGKAML